MKEFMIQVGTFMLLGKTLLHFCPSEKYEKYLKLLFGFMIVIQFITPVLSFGNGKVMDEYIEKQKIFEKKFESSLAEVEDKWFLYSDEIDKQIEREQHKAEEMLQEQERETLDYDVVQETGEKSKTRDNIENGADEKNAVSRTEKAEESEGGKENDIKIDKVKIEVSGYE